MYSEQEDLTSDYYTYLVLKFFIDYYDRVELHERKDMMKNSWVCDDNKYDKIPHCKCNRKFRGGKNYQWAKSLWPSKTDIRTDIHRSTVHLPHHKKNIIINKTSIPDSEYYIPPVFVGKFVNLDDSIPLTKKNFGEVKKNNALYCPKKYPPSFIHVIETTPTKIIAKHLSGVYEFVDYRAKQRRDAENRIGKESQWHAHPTAPPSITYWDATPRKTSKKAVAELKNLVDSGILLEKGYGTLKLHRLNPKKRTAAINYVTQFETAKYHKAQLFNRSLSKKTITLV